MQGVSGLSSQQYLLGPLGGLVRPCYPDCLANSHPNGQGSTVLAEESPVRFNIYIEGTGKKRRVEE